MNMRLIVRTCLAAAAVLVFMGCSSSGTSGAPQQNPLTGQHPVGWTQNHWSAYLQNPASCTTCHGSTTDPTAAGGIAQVSCFGCHHPNGPNHPTTWSAFMQHGRQGAQLAAGATDFSMKGFASCTPCHGSDYATGVGKTTSCYTCHTKAPHPDAPWGSSNPPANAATSPSHDQTDPSNASECIKCHAAGSAINSALKIPFVAPPAGNPTPGCFNNTMCHGKS